jgi:two-component system LytT family response regulator
VLDQLAAAMKGERPRYPSRLPSRAGERVHFVELSRVTHIYAKDKLTFAAVPGRDHCIDATIAELEERLDPDKFVRIHRSTIVNIEHVLELFTWFGGKLLVRLNDPKKTELTVARDRVRALKDRLGL